VNTAVLILLVESSGLAKAQYELPPGIYTAGRGPNNLIVLDHETVSTIHCELEALEDGRVRVRDNGSTNGTWMNAEPVTEQILVPGSFDEMKEGFLQYVLLALVCLGLPGVAYYIPGVPGWVPKALTLAGSFYLSMAFLALIVTQSLVGLNPFFTVASIARAPLAYLAVSLAAMIALGLEYETSASGQAMAGPRGLQLVIGVLVTAVDLYLLFVWARLLGMFYRCYRERLAWEKCEE